MSPATVIETPENLADLKTGIAQYLAEIEQLREQMSRDQAEIESSRKRTRALLAELKSILSQTSGRAS